MALLSPAAGQPALEVDGLDVVIATSAGPLHAVNGVSFQVGHGETFAIVGESGCGKSMTALAIMGLLPRAARADARACRLEGRELMTLDLHELSELRGNRVAMIFQDPMTALNPVYTIGDQLAEVYRHHKRSNRAAALERAVYLLERVGIPNASDRLTQYPHELSGGLRQRVMIAMATMCEPSLLIADEPTTALDVTTQARILHLLRDLQRDLGMAIVLITHDLGVVAGVADRVAVMYAGTIVETGSTRQVFKAPAHPYTRGLIDSIPVPGTTEPGGRLKTIPGMVPSLIGETTGCLFRNRCSLASATCAAGEIAERETEPGHRYRCTTTAAALRQDSPTVRAP
jgi:peptide/nickel transport system ATP-binding protein